MAETIIDGLGAGNMLVVNSDGSINISGTVNASVTTGSKVYVIQTVPTSGEHLNERYGYDYVGSLIGSINFYSSAGSFVKTITYDAGSNVISISSWSVI